MKDNEELIIWRYMDVKKFIHLLLSKSLYFSCIARLDDTFEGMLPKSHIEAHERLKKDSSYRLYSTIEKLNQLEPGTLESQQNLIKKDPCLMQEALKRDPLFEYKNNLTAEDALIITSLQFGINCWHSNEHESEAMWKLYGYTHGIAIKSTSLQLSASIIDPPFTVYSDLVRYNDFVNDPIERNHRHYAGFIKKKSFSHEKEFRASIKLKIPGKGMLVSCDLDKLINGIYISPFSESFFKEIVESLVEKYGLQKSVYLSSLSIRPERHDEIINDPRTYKFIEELESKMEQSKK